MKKLAVFLAIFTTLNFSLLRPVSAMTDSPIFIKAINPGYTVDGVSNVGELIELAKNVDGPLSLAGFVLSYTNSSGNSVILYEFPEGSWMTGESILLRLASSPDSELADLVYPKTLAFKAGPLMLTKDETIYDSVCWNNRDGCQTEFKSAEPTTLLRDTETNEFSHVIDYAPVFTAGNYRAEPLELNTEPLGTTPEETPIEESVLPRQCEGLEFSEIYTYYESDPSEQFIEFFNTTNSPINLENCSIRYKKKIYSLTGIIEPSSYYAIEPEFTLTKNPVRSNLIELIDIDDSVVDALDYPNGQKVLASFAKIPVEGTFMVTYDITPGAANNYQKYRNCEEGKVINPDTGKCVKETTATVEPKTCPEGSYLNTQTNRCKKIVSNTGADYGVTSIVAPADNEKASFIALSAVIAVLAAGFVFFIFEFRFEIKKFCGKVFRPFRRKPRPALDHR